MSGELFALDGDYVGDVPAPPAKPARERQGWLFLPHVDVKPKTAAGREPTLMDYLADMGAV